MHETDHSGRNQALINGALIAGGAIAVIDNLVAHWLLGLHRAVPGPSAMAVEVMLVLVGAVLLGLGVWREVGARKRI